MSEIQVMIPLSVFGDAKDLTPQGIAESIQMVSDYKKNLAEQMARNDVLVKTIQNMGGILEDIWAGSINEYERAKSVRDLITDMKNFKG